MNENLWWWHADAADSDSAVTGGKLRLQRLVLDLVKLTWAAVEAVDKECKLVTVAFRQQQMTSRRGRYERARETDPELC